MRTTPPKASKRYVTVSVSPDVHRQLLTILRPRETMSELVARLFDDHTAWISSRQLEH